jgi:hypothetical protein
MKNGRYTEAVKHSARFNIEIDDRENASPKRWNSGKSYEKKIIDRFSPNIRMKISYIEVNC